MYLLWVLVAKQVVKVLKLITSFMFASRKAINYFVSQRWENKAKFKVYKNAETALNYPISKYRENSIAWQVVKEVAFLH